MKRTKQGVSLIVLVITIIVMIVLAATVIISLSSTNIFNQAEEAVNKTNIKEVQSAASLAWMEAYLDESITTDAEYDTYVKNKLRDQGINPDNYYLKITKDGVTVKEDDLTTPMITVATETASIEPGEQIVYTVAFSDNEELGTINLTADKITLNGFTATVAVTGTGNVRTIILSNVQGTAGNKTITIAAGVATDTSGNTSQAVTSEAFALEEGISTLGELVTSAADYGKTVNYEANGISKWQVFYEDKDNGYVFLIAEDTIEHEYSSADSVDNSLYKIFTLGEEDSFPFDTSDYASSYVANMLGSFGSYASEGYMDKDGNSYVVGAIGSPTLHLFLKAYNEIKGKSYEVVYDLDFLGCEEDMGGYEHFSCQGRYGYYVNTIGHYSVELGSNVPFASGKFYFAAPSGAVLPNSSGGGIYYLSGVWNGVVRLESEIIANLGSVVNIRPVVCLRSDIPATKGTTTDFALGE